MECCLCITLDTINPIIPGVVCVLQHGAATRLGSGVGGCVGVPGDGHDASAPLLPRTSVHDTLPLVALKTKTVHLF